MHILIIKMILNLGSKIQVYPNYAFDETMLKYIKTYENESVCYTERDAGLKF